MHVQHNPLSCFGIVRHDCAFTFASIKCEDTIYCIKGVSNSMQVYTNATKGLHTNDIFVIQVKEEMQISICLQWLSCDYGHVVHIDQRIDMSSKLLQQTKYDANGVFMLPSHHTHTRNYKS